MRNKCTMYSSRGNHGYVTNIDMFFAKQLIFGRNFRNILLLSFVNISKPQQLSSSPNLFLGSRFPSSTPICSSGPGLRLCLSTFYSQSKGDKGQDFQTLLERDRMIVFR